MADTASRWRTADFDYHLPEELIAQRPLPDRDTSRLLVVHRGDGTTARLEDRRFADLVDVIPPGDLLVLNTTRVRRARLFGRRASGGLVELLLVHPEPEGTWRAMGRPGSALREGKRIVLGPEVTVEVVRVHEDGLRSVRVHGATAEEAMARYGRVPLPPYIERDPDPSDDQRYQTVYAEREGSVAAPTAGLHFTPAVLGTLRTKGVRLGSLDLEVGPGTFRPVETDDLSQHTMHPERFDIGETLVAAVADVRSAGGKVWAVGTTVVRALESAAGPDGTLRPGPGETNLFIIPGFRFQVVDRLLTNFHLPRSTLLMLVSAFGGVKPIRLAYGHAIEERYRFYSYGDAMLIL